MKRLLFIPLFFISLILQAQTPLLIEGQTYTNSDASWQGVNISRSVPTLLTFRNNSITSVNTSGYMLQCGDDDTRATANNLDDAVIKGNKLDWNGTPYATFCHGMMAGYNINYDIKYNYIDGPYYGVVHEGGHDDGTSMVNADGGICYNIFKNCTFGVLTMGYENVYIYNNIFYMGGGDADGMITVKSSNGTDIPAPSKNVKIKNNIFYSVNNVRAIELFTGSEVGFECDYNVYYWVGTSGNLPRFRYNGSIVSWATWRSLGYDTHSIVVNPNFNNFTDFIPSEAIYSGYNLGADYSYGLASTAAWVVDEYPDTLQQVANEGGYWQVGAILLPAEEEPSPTALYVSTTGNDSNPGTFASPWLTWKHAFATAQAGDTVYFRGGVYYATSSSDKVTVSYSGTAGNPICFFAYPSDWAAGNYPILDFKNVTFTSTYNYMIRGYNGKDYIELNGLTIRNITQGVGQVVQAICFELCDNIKIENCIAYNIGGQGIGLYGCSGRNYITNCDVYNVCDTLNSDPGQNGVGFQWSTIRSLYGDDMYNARLYFKGCRTWNFSDNGFAGPGVGYVELDSCWAWNGGLLHGEGCGFKYNNESYGDFVNDTSRYIHNCIAADNGFYGFSPNNLSGTAFNGRYYNNFLYHNGYKHEMAHWTWYFGVGLFIFNYSGSAPPQELYANNLIYLSEYANVYVQDTYTHNHNSWDLSVMVNAQDFLSLDTAQLRWTRQADGSLPDITFGKLAETSDLINKGVDVGLPYGGAAPDLGWAEYEVPETPVAPVVLSITGVYASKTSATITCNVIDGGGASVTARGVCWNDTGDPDIDDNKTTNGSGLGSFTAIITGLSEGTTYYVRAYATNSAGTSYDPDQTEDATEFTTQTSGLIITGGWITSSGKWVMYNGKWIKL